MYDAAKLAELKKPFSQKAKKPNSNHRSRIMKVQGGCYCGAVRYEASGDPMMRAECYWLKCQYITGGANVLVMGMPFDRFTLVKGAVKGFTQ